METGAITAVYEAGFMMPEAGQDGAWLKENMRAFEQRAADGDEEFKDLVEDVKNRGMI